MTDTPKWKQDAEWDVFTPPGETLSFVRCDGVIVAACSTTGKDDHKENAALFAAADDLYKALEVLLEVAEGEFNDTDTLVGPKLDGARAALIESTR